MLNSNKKVTGISTDLNIEIIFKIQKVAIKFKKFFKTMCLNFFSKK